MTVKAWVDFEGGNIPVVKDSHNVSLVERVGRGEYIVHWTEPFTNEHVSINNDMDRPALIAEIHRERLKIIADGKITLIAYGE